MPTHAPSIIEDELDRPPRSRRARSPRQSVRALLKKLAWIDFPFIYWTGHPFPDTQPNQADASPTTIIQTRLTHLPSAPYAIKFSPALAADSPPASLAALLRSQTPRIGEPIRIDLKLIAKSLRALAQASTTNASTLTRYVGNIAAWRTRCQTALNRARAILNSIAADDPYAITQCCLIIGAITVPTIGPKQNSIPAHLQQAFCNWPRDILHQAIRAAGQNALQLLARKSPAANQPAVAAALRDHLLLKPSAILDFLQALPELLTLHQTLAEHPRRRLFAAIAIQRSAIRQALLDSGASGNPLSAIEAASPQRAVALHLFFHRYQCEISTSLTRYFAPLAIPNHPASEDDPTAPFDLVRSLRDVICARALRPTLLGPTTRDAKQARPLRWTRRGGVGSLILENNPAPLTFESLPDSAALLLMQSPPPEPLDLSLFLRLVAIDALPLHCAAATDWIEQCSQVWPPGRSGADPIQAALLNIHFVHANCPPEHQRAGITALNTLALPLLKITLLEKVSGKYKFRQSPLEQHRLAELIGKAIAAGINLDSLAWFFAQDYLLPLFSMIELSPRHLRPFADFIRRIDQTTTALGGAPFNWTAWKLQARPAFRWPAAFLTLGPEFLERLIKLLNSKPLDKADFAEFIFSLSNFIAGEDGCVASHSTLAKNARLSLLNNSFKLLQSTLNTADDDALPHILSLFTRCLDAVEAANLGQHTTSLDPAQFFHDCFTPLLHRLLRTTPIAKSPFFADRSGSELSAMAPIARGHAHRLLTLGLFKDEIKSSDVQPIFVAWKYLARFPSLQELLSIAATRSHRTSRALKLLARIGLCLRLCRQHQLTQQLQDLTAPSVPVQPGQSESLRQLQQFRPQDNLPTRIQNIINRHESFTRELASLESRANLSPSAQQRAAHLHNLLNHPHCLADWVARDLNKLLPAAVDDALLTRLESIADGVIASHFRQFLPAAPKPSETLRARQNWDNAIRLYLSTTANRSTLRRLLLHEAAGDRSWLRTHPANLRFLNTVRAAGVDADAWLGPFSRTIDSPAGPCRIELETDPLHVLQMGNYFATCLSEGDCNSFATVPNAVEANKRVIYVYQTQNGKESVIGRKLLLLTHKGRLIGYNTYGQLVPSPSIKEDDKIRWKWLKTALDHFCHDLARHCNAIFQTRKPSELDEPLEGKETALFPLFGKWYDDGAEPFYC